MKDFFWGGLLIGIGLFTGASVFLGDVTWFNLLFDTLGVYWVGRGLLGLWQGSRPGDPALDGAPNPAVAKAASQVLANLHASYALPASLESADARDFKHLDLPRYEACDRSLQKRGFRLLGDFAHRGINQSATTLLAPTVLRIWSSEDSQSVVAYVQIHPHLARRVKGLVFGLSNLRWIDAPSDFVRNLKMRQCVDVETEFDDGSFLVTSNAPLADLLSQPASIQSDFHPPGTSLPDLLSRHQGKLARISHEGQRRPLAIRTADDMLNMQKRLAAQKRAHRESLGWITREELAAMSGGNAPLAEAIHMEIQRQLASDRAGSPRPVHTSPSMR